MSKFQPADDLTPELFLQRWNPNAICQAGSRKNSLQRMPRDRAVERRFIEVNARSAMNAVVVDLDNDYSQFVLFDLINAGTIPMYSWVVYNPESEHAHVGWFINGFARSKKAKQFLKDITKGLTRTLAPYGGDLRYTHHSTRNPLFSMAEVEWGTAHEYSFDELMTFTTDQVVDSTAPVARTRTVKGESHVELDADSSSRNHDLFAAARQWAYRHYNKVGRDRSVFNSDLHAYVTQRNREFARPLPADEVKTITDSITRFCVSKLGVADRRRRKVTTEHVMTSSELSQVQSYFSNLRASVRNKAATFMELIALNEAGFTSAQIGEQLGIKAGTVRAKLKRARAWVAEQTAPVEEMMVNPVTGEVLETVPAAEADDVFALGHTNVFHHGSSEVAAEVDDEFARGHITVVHMDDFDWAGSSSSWSVEPELADELEDYDPTFMRDMLRRLVS